MAPKAKVNAKAKTKLDAKTKASSTSGTAGAQSQRSLPSARDAEAIAKEVLRLSQIGDYAAILRVLGDPVTSSDGLNSSGGAAARKAFLRISMLIHPDKLPGFSDATRAFQALVQAFDRTQTGPPAAAGEPLKQKALTRSNEGCFRTEVQCPRCKVAWGAPCEGNPPYYYNFMMQGLRCFTCSTCLTSFGCYSAVHLCPCCRRPFEYWPEMYNQKVTCGHPDCRKQFGFLLHHVSEQALKAAKDQVRTEFEQRSKAVSSRNARADRAARRSGDVAVDQEASFVLGLRDVCPRCGLELESFEDGAQLQHLRNCNDGAAHESHQARQQQKAKSKEVAADKNKLQLSAASNAVWTFSGGRVGELHILDEAQLKQRCKLEGLPAGGDYVALVDRLAEKCAARGDPIGPAQETIPRRLDTLSNKKLAAVCAAHRLSGLGSREEQIEALNELLESEQAAKPKALTGRQARPKAVADRGSVLAIEDAPRRATPKSSGTSKSNGKPQNSFACRVVSAAKSKVNGKSAGKPKVAVTKAKRKTSSKSKPKAKTKASPQGKLDAKRRRGAK